ncbi:hypothetical protein [Neptunomonas qingdaonensis]|uniref:Uncharacterized protein n=1 Tax=Neptunomonas qingdaonensis TaxID=1045558 RepID=A0A1I2VX75_9GAMM|nr:hypothetical protein [Neptunomonas qingdaonensis]SFG93734.1 hypothetical protein SAMN05216175_12042 [Neptunomonas qingdaonensis]
MDVIANLALILGCVFYAAQLFRQPKTLTDNNKTVVLLLLLSVVFIIAAAAGQLLINAQNPDSQTLQRLLSNMKDYLALPLISSLLLATSFNKFWSRVGWGRWVLVLIALFELARRAEVGEQYAIILAGFSSAALLLAFIRYAQANIRLPGLVGALLASLSIAVYGTLSLLPAYQNAVLSNGMLAISFVPLALATREVISLHQKPGMV